MSLNIKNERVHEMARQAAARTGKSQTSVIEKALRRYLDELDRETSREAKDKRLYEILEDMQQRIAAVGGLMDHNDLYDERGLPA